MANNDNIKRVIQASSFAFGPLGVLVGAGLGLYGDTKKTLDEIDPTKKNENLAQAEYQRQLLIHEAKVKQENGVALRIISAEEVEIEEFYDNSHSSKGKVGAEANGNKLGASFGGSHETSVITRRIYRFKGYNKELLESYDELLKSDFPDKETIEIAEE